jgi:hypothetical protein
MEVGYHDSDLRVPIPNSSQNTGILINCYLTDMSVNVTLPNSKDDKFQNIIYISNLKKIKFILGILPKSHFLFTCKK